MCAPIAQHLTQQANPRQCLHSKQISLRSCRRSQTVRPTGEINGPSAKCHQQASNASHRSLPAQKDELKTLNGPADLWPLMREEAERKAKEEPILGSYFHATILNHRTFGDALSFRLASKLDNPMLPTMLIRDVIAEATHNDAEILSAAEIDIIATYTRDPA